MNIEIFKLYCDLFNQDTRALLLVIFRGFQCHNPQCAHFYNISVIPGFLHNAQRKSNGLCVHKPIYEDRF